MYSPAPKFIPPRAWLRKPTSRQKVLAEWRGLDLTDLEQARANSSKSAAAILPFVLKSIGLDKQRANLEILKVWNNLMDPLVVAHAQPTGLVKGTLFVTVDSNPWLDEIVRYRRKEILTRLQHSFGRDLILKISYRVG